MDGDTPTRIFISYSRADSQFVDRLEADLRSRRFDPWVDRRKLEGGQDWQDELQCAIDRCQVVCVVLTPTALGSDAVKMEYRYAQRNRKPLIPLMLKECELPMELGTVQWVDFQGSYDDGLKNTVAALSRLDHNGATDASPAAASQIVNLRDLYARGLEAERQGNLEQAATFYGQIHDKEPGYLNGIVASKLTTLNERLYPERSRRLWEDAKRYRRAGEYSREVGALQALIGLGPKDAQAEERLPVAIQNRDNADLYDVVQELVSLDDTDAAREQLTLLWQNAPYYEDPEGVAPRLGMNVPPSYEDTNARRLANEREVNARRLANERRKQLEMRYRTDRDAAISYVEESTNRSTQQIEDTWQRANIFMPHDLLERGARDTVQQLTQLGVIQQGSDDLAFNRLLQATDNIREALKAKQAAESRVEKAGKGLPLQVAVASVGCLVFVSSCGAVAFLIALVSVIFKIGSGSDFAPDQRLPLWITTITLCVLAPILGSLWRYGKRQPRIRAERNVTSRQKAVDEFRLEYEHLYLLWRRDAEPRYQALLRRIQQDHDQQVASINAQYASEAASLDEQHDREMAAIASRYQSVQPNAQ